MILREATLCAASLDVVQLVLMIDCCAFGLLVQSLCLQLVGVMGVIIGFVSGLVTHASASLLLKIHGNLEIPVTCVTDRGFGFVLWIWFLDHQRKWKHTLIRLPVDNLTR